MSFVDKANQYAKDVLSGKQPACKWVRLACERYQRDRKAARKAGSDYVFVEHQVEATCMFIELLPHVEGMWATKGLRLTLQPWQCFILANIFGFYHRKLKDGKRVRRYREAYIEVPRKNGKTAFAAAIALTIMCLDDEAGAKLFCGATSLDQANILFNTAKGMIRRAPDVFNEEVMNLAIQTRSIMFKGVDSNGLQDVRHFNSLVRTPKDGTNPHFAVIDEYHEHQTDALVSSLRTGMGARAQPLLFEITTAGYDIASPCFSQRHVVTQVLQQSVTADDFFGIIYTIDDGDDWESLDSWKKANPNYGVSVNEDDVDRTLSLARQIHTKQTEAKVKRLNIWGQVADGYLDMRRWNALGDSTLRLEAFKGKPCYMGFDLSEANDITSLCLLFPDDDDPQKTTAFWRNWLPQGTVNKVENEHYRRFEQQGWLTVMEGDTIRHTQLLNEVVEYIELFDVQGFGYDPWGMHQLVEALEEKVSVPFEAFRQNISTMTVPLRHLQNVVIGGELRHEDNPLVNWMAGNVTVKDYGTKGLMVQKNKVGKGGMNKNKIDGILALTMALGLHLNALGEKQPVNLYDGTHRTVF